MSEELTTHDGLQPEMFEGTPLTFDHSKVDDGEHQFVVPDIVTAHMIAYRICVERYETTLPEIKALDTTTPQANIRLDGYDISYSLRQRRMSDTSKQFVATIKAINHNSTKPLVDEMIEAFIAQNEKLKMEDEFM